MAAADYTSVDLVKAQLGIEAADESQDDLIQAAVTAASRSIDRWTGTTFFPVTETRAFYASGDGVVWVDRFTSTTDLVVKTGTGGTYGTTVGGSAYVLLPPNAPARGDAYDRIVIPNGGIPTSDGFPNVEVTAAWGWSEVPADIAQAALIKAAALYRRKDSPEEFGGALDETSVRLAGAEDSDVRTLLRPYTDLGLA